MLIINNEFSTITQMPEVLFGNGARKSIGEKLAEYDCQNVLIICDSFLNRNGQAAELAKIIHDANIQSWIFECYEGESDAYKCDTAYEYATTIDCDGIVGLGGGSTMDTAKMVALLLKNGGKAIDYINRPDKKKVDLFQPLITMPTTAGTGAEVSQWISCSPDGISRGTAIHTPTFAIIDPEYTLAMPKSVTANAGLDALCHAFLSIITGSSNRLFSFTNGSTSKEAIRHIGTWLKIAYDEPEHLEAREHMCFASLLSGYANRLNRGSFIRAFSNQLIEKYHIAHGVGSAIALRCLARYMVLDPTHAHAKGIAEALNLPFSEEGETASQEIVLWIDNLLDHLGIKSMKAYGVTQEFIPDAIAAARADCDQRSIFDALDINLMEQSIYQLWEEGK